MPDDADSVGQSLAAEQSRGLLTRRLWYHPTLPQVIADRLLTCADGLLEEGTILKAGKRCTVLRIEHAGEPFLVKHYHTRGPLHSGLHVLTPSRAWRCWVHGQSLAARTSTPQPLALIEERVGPFLSKAVHVSEFVAGVTLRKQVRDLGPTREHVDDYARQFALIWQTLGELGLEHGDLKTTNVLVSQDGRLWLIDLDSMRRHRWQTIYRIRRSRDLARFMADWREMPDAAAMFETHLNRANLGSIRTPQTL